MNVLHVVSNFRWTERAEPAADLAVAQRELGAHVAFICGRHPVESEDSIEFHARQRGLDPIVLDMPKHFKWRSARRDILRLRGLMTQRPFDAVHCHMPNAHLLVSLAARGVSGRPLVVASSYEPDGPRRSFRLWLSLRRTDGLVVIGDRARRRVVEDLGWAASRVSTIEPGVDLCRFAHRSDLPGREAFGLGDRHFVVGMVTRVNRRRRVDIALEAVARIAPRFPEVRLLIVGRGKLNEMVEKPARALGIADRVISAGYCRGDRLVTAYRSMDLLVYTVPGSDRSCRTVREAMAAGVPTVASDIGFLPTLVEEGTTGRIVEPSADAFASALADLLADRKRLCEMSAAALEISRRRFSRVRQAEKVLAFYQNILNG